MGQRDAFIVVEVSVVLPVRVLFDGDGYFSSFSGRRFDVRRLYVGLNVLKVIDVRSSFVLRGEDLVDNFGCFGYCLVGDDSGVFFSSSPMHRRYIGFDMYVNFVLVVFQTVLVYGGNGLLVGLVVHFIAKKPPFRSVYR